MFKKTISILIGTCIILMIAEFSQGQSFNKVSDKQQIEFALDMIRKGVQQSDTAKVIKIFGQNLKINGGDLERETASLNLQSIFDNSSERTMLLTKTRSAKLRNPVRQTNLWDFDILNPKILIRGDTAFVDCELVLWGAPSVSSLQKGRHIKETFIFVSPPDLREVPTGDGNHEWGNNRSKIRAKQLPRGWELASCDKLFDFLSNIGVKNVKKEKAGE